MWDKEQVKDFIEKNFKKIPTKTEIEVLYSTFLFHYRQGEIDSLHKIKDVLNIKECQCQ